MEALVLSLAVLAYLAVNAPSGYPLKLRDVCWIAVVVLVGILVFRLW